MSESATKLKTTKITNPTDFFKDWHYRIDTYHWSALGVAWRKFIVDKHPIHCYATDNPPQLAFQEGDVFHSNTANDNCFLQVAAKSGDGITEVHAGRVGSQEQFYGYTLRDAEFATWLKTGHKPKTAQPVLPGMSRAGLLAWQIMPKQNSFFP